MPRGFRGGNILAEILDMPDKKYNLNSSNTHYNNFNSSITHTLFPKLDHNHTSPNILAPNNFAD